MPRSESPPVNAARILLCVRVVVLSMWPASSWAGSVVFSGQSFDTVSASAWIAAVAMSTLGGLTSLLWKVQLMLTNNEPVPAGRWRLGVFLAANLLMSWFAGTLAFFIGLHTELPLFLLAITIGFAAFLGAKFVDMTVGKFIK